jgi:hypothetical protein
VSIEEHQVKDFVGSSGAEDQSQEDSDLIKYIFDLYNEYKDSSYRQAKIKESADNRKKYSGIRDSKSFPWENCANYSMMLDAIVVDNIEPRIVSAVIGKERDIIQVNANTPEAVQFADKVEQFSEWALTHNVKWQKYVPQWVHDVLLDGTGYVFPHYEEKTLKRGKRFHGPVPIHPVDGARLDPKEATSLASTGVPVESETVDEIQTGPKTVFKVVNEFESINQVYGPDLCIDWDDTPTIRKRFVKYEDLEELSEANGGPYMNITEDLKSEKTSTRYTDDMPTGSRDDQSVPERTNEDIEVLDAYIKYNLGDDRDWCIVTVTARGKTLLRKQYVRDVYYGLIGKPVKRLVIFPDSGKQFGTGIPWKIRHHASAINDCLNQMIDSGTVQINPWFFYGSDAGIPDELDISPGGANPVVGNVASVQFPQLGVKAAVYVEFINLISSFLERLISLSSYQSGAEDSNMGQGAGTASGMRMILQEAQIKHTYQSTPIKLQLEEIIKLDIMLYGWYIPSDAKIKVPGSEIFDAVDIEALQHDYDYSIMISDGAYNNMMARTEAQELLAISAQMPFVNQAEMFKDMLKAYDKKNPDMYLQPGFLELLQTVAQNPEIPQVVQKYIAQKQEQLKDQQMQQGVQDGIKANDMKEQALAPRFIQDAKRSVEKQLIKENIKGDLEMNAALAQKHLVTPKHMAEAEDAHSKRIAKELVDGTVGKGMIHNE